MTAILSTYWAFSRCNGFIWRRIAKKRLADGKEDLNRIKEKFGIAGRDRPEGPLLWCHGASVGETLALMGLIERFLDRFAHAHVLVTSGTTTSAEILEKRLPPRAMHQYVPYDNAGYARRFLTHWQPDVCVFTESDFWPALMKECALNDVPMVLIGGRVSDKTQRLWQRFPASALQLLSHIDRFQVQSQDLATGLVSLGLPADAIEVTGFLKQDLHPLPYDEAQLHQIKTRVAGRDVWCAASTHDPEEETILEAHAALGGDALLILVPRHPERADAIQAMIDARGLRSARRSAGQEITDETQVYLADTMGEMGLWYALSDVAFIGGSLTGAGGHNPYEPALLDCAIIHGPVVHNFEQPYAELCQNLAAITVTDAESLAEAVRLLWQNPNDMIARAKAALTPEQSATDKALDMIGEYFKDR